MIALFVYTLAAFGLAYVLGFSKISLLAREQLGFGALGTFGALLLMLVECPACLGFWTGLLSGIVYSPFDHPRSVGVALVLAFYTCATNYLLGRATRLISEA